MCIRDSYMPDGVCDYFLMWICVGLPFGIKSDLRAGSMCSIDPYANSGHFTHTNIREIPEDFVRTRVPENQRVKKRWSMAAASALVAPLCGWR